jgi:hypothetical protein
MTHSERYRAKAAALTETAHAPSNFSLRSEYEYIAAVYLRLAEQADIDGVLRAQHRGTALSTESPKTPN